MDVQRTKIAVATRNIANAGTTAPEGNGDYYRPQSVRTTVGDRHDFQRLLLDQVSPGRRAPVFANAGTGAGGLGPQAEIVETESFRYEYDPTHPDADENGMVRYPDINMIREMSQMVSASRLYEANVSAIEAEKEIIKRSLEI